MKDLIHLFDEGGSFSDLTIDLNNYDVGTNSLVLASTTDYLYCGLYKQFKNIYVGIEANDLAGAVTFEYYNGTTWVALTVVDESSNFSRSGFISFELPSDWATVAVSSKTNYYIRFTGTIEVELSGINMLLANDNDLREHYRQINDYIGADSSFIALHQASKKDIIQKIRNAGKVKISSIDGLMTDLTIWDFMRPEQLRSAAAYLCLSKIFAGVSDSNEGKFFELSRDFKDEYKNAVDTFLLNVDFDDSGEEEASEESYATNISRIVTL